MMRQTPRCETLDNVYGASAPSFRPDGRHCQRQKKPEHSTAGPVGDLGEQRRDQGKILFARGDPFGDLQEHNQTTTAGMFSIVPAKRAMPMSLTKRATESLRRLINRASFANLNSLSGARG